MFIRFKIIIRFNMFIRYKIIIHLKYVYTFQNNYSPQICLYVSK